MQRHHCDICDKKEFATKGGLVRHQTTVHTTERPYQCDICHSKFKRPDTLSNHRRIVHSSSHSKPKKSKCDVRDQKVTSQGNALKHRRTTSDPKPQIKAYECEVCRKKFIRKSNMHVHQKLVHGNVQPGHSVGDNKTIQEKCHLNSVLSKLKSHRCHICGRTFARNYNMLRHQRSVHQIETSSYRHRKRAIENNSTVFSVAKAASKYSNVGKCLRSKFKGQNECAMSPRSEDRHSQNSKLPDRQKKNKEARNSHSGDIGSHSVQSLQYPAIVTKQEPNSYESLLETICSYHAQHALLSSSNATTGRLDNDTACVTTRRSQRRHGNMSTCICDKVDDAVVTVKQQSYPESLGTFTYWPVSQILGDELISTNDVVTMMEAESSLDKKSLQFSLVDVGAEPSFSEWGLLRENEWYRPTVFFRLMRRQMGARLLWRLARSPTKHSLRVSLPTLLPSKSKKQSKIINKGTRTGSRIQVT